MITAIDFEILPELRDCLPRQTPEQRKRLKEGIERDGMLYGILLCTIKGMPGRYILDGHTRYEIALDNDFAWKVDQDDVLRFDSIDDAVCWIIENQAARRNLTEAQERIVLAELYERRKRSHGGAEYRNGTSGQFDHLKTSDLVAKERGVSPKTVRRAAAEKKKLDTLGLTSAVMDGTVKKIEAAALDELAESVEADPERKEELVEKFVEKAKENNGRAKPSRDFLPDEIKPMTYQERQISKFASSPEGSALLKSICEQVTEESDPEMELILNDTLVTIRELIYGARSEWSQGLIQRLKKGVIMAFECELPEEWRD